MQLMLFTYPSQDFISNHSFITHIKPWFTAVHCLPGYLCPVFFAGMVINPVLEIILGALGLFFVMAVSGAARVIFISAVYHNLNGDPVKNFDEQFAENLFRTK